MTEPVEEEQVPNPQDRWVVKSNAGQGKILVIAKYLTEDKALYVADKHNREDLYRSYWVEKEVKEEPENPASKGLWRVTVMNPEGKKRRIGVFASEADAEARAKDRNDKEFTKDNPSRHYYVERVDDDVLEDPTPEQGWLDGSTNPIPRSKYSELFRIIEETPPGNHELLIKKTTDSVDWTINSFRPPVPDSSEESKHAPITNAEYWGKSRRAELPASLEPRNFRDLALIIGERLGGMQMALPGHIMTTDDTDSVRAHLNGYQDALEDILQLLTDDDGEMRKRHQG